MFLCFRLRLVEPTWEEFYGKDDEPKPFDHYFNMKDEDDLEIFDNMVSHQLVMAAANAIHSRKLHGGVCRALSMKASQHYSNK